MTHQRTTLFFFSGTGNTWWVGERIAEALNTRGAPAELLSIEGLPRVEVEQKVAASDVIGIGYPIYASDAPLLMQQFIADLPPQNTPKDLLVYITQMGWSGNGAYFLHRALEKKGYRLRWAVEFNMPNNIGIHYFPAYSTPDYESFTPMLQTALQRAETLADRMVAGEDWVQGSKTSQALSSLMQRVPWRLMLRWAQKHTWNVDADLCNACGRCARICPVGNIEIHNGLPHWSDKCNFCLRCYNYCPQQAILAYKKPFDPQRGGAQPFQGPVREFKPEHITAKQR